MPYPLALTLLMMALSQRLWLLRSVAEAEFFFVGGLFIWFLPRFYLCWLTADIVGFAWLSLLTLTFACFLQAW